MAYGPRFMRPAKGQGPVGTGPAHDGGASDELQYQNDQQNYHEHGYYQAYGAVHTHLPSLPRPQCSIALFPLAFVLWTPVA